MLFKMDKVTDTSNTRLKDGKSELRLRLHLSSSHQEEDGEKQMPEQDARIGLFKNAERDKSVLDSSDDENDVPLVNLLKKIKDKKQSEQTVGQTLSSEGQTQDDGVSSDDEPLSKVKKSRPAKKALTNQNPTRSIHMGKRTAVPDSSDDEDDVPLVSLLKKTKDKKQSEQTAGQTLSSEAPQTQHDDDSSGDEPLAERTKARSPKNAAEIQNQATSRRRSKETAVLDSSDDEDDVPLVNLLKKIKDKKQSEQTAGDSSDDEPLSKAAKSGPAKKALANQNQSRSIHMGKRTAVLDSSDDEDDVPLVSLLKKTKREKQSEQTAGDSSDDEPLSKAAKSGPAKKALANQNQSRSIHMGKRTAVLDSSDDEDDVPLVNLLKKTKREKQSEQTAGQTLSSEAPQTQHDDKSSGDEPLAERTKARSPKNAAEIQNQATSRRRSKETAVLNSSDDEDDVPLVSLLKKLKDDKQSEQTAGDSSDDEPVSKAAKSGPAKKASANQNQSRSIHMGKRTAVLDSSDDEDDVPLVNLLKKIKDKKQSEQTSGDSSDDEPLSKVAKSGPAKKALANQNQSRSIHMGKRTAVLYSSDDGNDVPLVSLLKKTKNKKHSEQTAGQTLSSEAPQTQHDDDSSDDEPLSKFTKTGPSKKVAANQIELKSSRRTYKRTESSDGSSDDDDVPLVNLIRKNQSTTKTKTKTRSTPAQRSTSKPTTRAPRMHVTTAESSDNEPLINLLKKPLKDTTNTTLPQGNGKRTEKRGQTPWNNNQGPSGKTTVTKKMKKQRAGNNGLSSDSSDDEPLVKITKIPQVTMLLKVMVERCRVKEFGNCEGTVITGTGS